MEEALRVRMGMVKARNSDENKQYNNDKSRSDER